MTAGAAADTRPCRPRYGRAVISDRPDQPAARAGVTAMTANHRLLTHPPGGRSGSPSGSLPMTVPVFRLLPAAAGQGNG